MATRDELIAVANTYLQQGLLDHEPDAVLFADDCVRIEMGVETGGNAAQLRELLADPAYAGNRAMHDKQWIVEDPWVHVIYDLELDKLPDPMRVSTRFRIIDGRIQYLEVVFDAGALHDAIVASLEPLRTDR